jgi:phage terminase large subunit-like protein
MAEPRWSSPRTDRATQAGAVAAVAEQLGLPLLPWQALVLGTALEQQDGRPAYRDVLVSVPRQSGKSSLALALIVDRLLRSPEQHVLYSAQNRLAARSKMLGWWPRIAASPLAGRFTLYRGFGAERITSCDNGSTLELLSANESAGHGDTTDLVVVDEAWVHQDARVEQAVRPTMATREHAQLWAMSTAGTGRSTWWRTKLDAGRAAAEMGVADELACFEWSAPDGANPADESTWWATMPALGHLITARTVQTDLANMGVREFSRAYLNQWPDPAGEGWGVISEDQWQAAIYRPEESESIDGTS